MGSKQGGAVGALRQEAANAQFAIKRATCELLNVREKKIQ